MNFIQDRLEPAPQTAAFWLRDRALFGATFLACVLVYGYPLTNFALHIDVEAAAVYGSIGHTFTLGRWGLSLVHMFVLHEPVVPYFTPLLSLLLITLAALAAERVFSFPPAQRYAFTILYVSFPQFAYQLEFSNQSDCVAFGILCATLSFIALRSFLLRPFSVQACPFLLLSTALLVVAASFYDSIIFVVPVLCSLWCLHGLLDEDIRLAQIFRVFVWSAGVTVCAYAVMALIGKAFQASFHLAPDSSYFSSLIGWRSHSVADSISRVAGFISADVMGRDYYGNELYLAAVAAAATLVALSVWRRREAARGAAIAMLAPACLLAPFVIVVLLGEHQEARTFVTEPIVFAAFITMAFCLVRVRPGVQTAIVAGLALISCLHVSRLFFADTMAWTSDKLIGNRIVQAIYAADPAFAEQTTPVYFHGAYSGPNIWMGEHYQVFGRSFFAWDGGATYRIIALLKASGIADMKLASPAEALAVEPAVQDMPVWPNPNAVRLVNGVMVVRLGQ